MQWDFGVRWKDENAHTVLIGDFGKVNVAYGVGVVGCYLFMNGSDLDAVVCCGEVGRKRENCRKAVRANVSFSGEISMYFRMRATRKIFCSVEAHQPEGRTKACGTYPSRKRAPPDCTRSSCSKDSGSSCWRPARTGWRHWFSSSTETLDNPPRPPCLRIEGSVQAPAPLEA